MPYSIVEIDGIQINPVSKRFPIEIITDPHMINDPIIHMGVLDDNQISISIMRVSQHQSDPHNMLIDGRDVSTDGEKLDGIQPGAQVNNLTDIQAQSLTSGMNSNWHNHDEKYYTKSQLQVAGSSVINWNNLTSVPTFFTPSAHDHNSIYYIKDDLYTKTQLDSGQLDSRYYTEIEVDQKITAASTGIKGVVQEFENLPLTENEGSIYIVRQTSGLNEEGFYRWNGVIWEFLSNNTGTSIHNQTLGLNEGDYRHLTESQYIQLTTSITTSLHDHNNLYYTKDESDTKFSNIVHNHNDLYYTKNELYNKIELDSIFITYYTKAQLDSGQLDSRYYTKTELLNGQLDSRYYTQSQISTNYYTKTQLDSGQLYSRYYTKTDLSDDGAIKIGITQISGLVSENVQQALNELNTKIILSGSSLDEAYLNGSTINITDNTVKLDSTLSTNSPIELTNRVNAPSTNLSAGQISIVDNCLYVFDGTRMKWLTPSKTLLFGRSGNVDGTFLRSAGGSTSGYRMQKNGTIIGATLNSLLSISKNVVIRINGINVFTLSIENGAYNNSSLDIDFNVNDVVQVYVEPAGAALSEVTSIIEFCWRA